MIGLLLLAMAQDLPAPVFRSGVGLVQISVVAHDKNGKPVADLRREDFQILDNGSPRDIRLFLAENSRAAPAEPKTPGVFTNRIDAGAPRDYSVILLDNLFTDFGDTEKGNGSANAGASALRALRSIPPGEVIAIYANSRKLQVICEFTSDRDLLERQLGRWKPGTDTADAGNDVLISSLGATSKDHRGDAPLEALAATVRMDAQLRAASSDEEMNLIADHLAGIPGRKNLIWLSARFAIGGRALRKLALAGIAIYPVDVAGVPCGRDWCPPIMRPMLLMDAIAAQTGGIAYHGRNDIDAAIRETIDDGHVSYTLGFYRSGDDTPDTVHHVAVHVSRPGVTLRYSASYQTAALPRPSTDPTGDLVRALNRPVDATAISIRASATRVKDSLNLKAAIDVPDLELAQSGDSWRGQLEIVARFTAADGKPAGEVVTQKTNLQMSQPEYDSAVQHGIDFLNELKIPPKAVEFKILFTDLVSGTMGTLTIPLSEVTAGETK